MHARLETEADVKTDAVHSHRSAIATFDLKNRNSGAPQLDADTKVTRKIIALYVNSIRWHLLHNETPSKTGRYFTKKNLDSEASKIGQLTLYFQTHMDYTGLVNTLSKDQILTAIATIILLFTALIHWTVYSWLTLLAVIILVVAWYFKSS